MCEHTLLLLTQQLLLMLLCNNEQQVSPVPDHLGRGHHITIVRDSTAVKKMESAKAYAEREALANKVKTETMQALSHELRTPLQVRTNYYTVVTVVVTVVVLYDCVSERCNRSVW
jgi:signal transduction histidine kinase